MSSDLPPPQTISNKDGTKTIITFRYNENNQKVKTIRRIRYVTHTETVNPRVADRKTWGKFGQSAKDGNGPASDTTSVGENIIFRPSVNWRKDAKDESADPNAQSMKDKLKDKKVKCRICNGEHFTARCPYKDTMAPMGEAGAGEGAGGMGDDPGASTVGAAAAGKKGSYVPPAMRGDRASAVGDRMGGSKFGERDDLATLRVTNVSTPTGATRNVRLLTICISGLRNGRGRRAPRHVRAVWPCHASVLGQGPRDRYGQGLCLHQLCRPRRRRQGMRQDGRIWFQASHSQGGVCQEGCVKRDVFWVILGAGNEMDVDMAL